MDRPARLSATEDLLSEFALEAVRRHPRFREAAETACASALAEYAAYDKATRWLTRDLGRAGLLGSALMLEATAGRVTVAALVQAAAFYRMGSRGRVLAWVQYAIEADRLGLPPGSEPWTQRPLTVRPSLIAFFRNQTKCNLAGAALLSREAAALAPLLESDDTVRAVSRELGRLILARPDLAANASSPMHLFLAREGGMRVLQGMLARQSPNRERLLEAARFSRAQIGRRCHVSRAHLNVMLGDAEAAGLVRLPTRNTIVFDPRLSDDFESYFALMFQFLRAAAIAVVESREL